MSRFGILPDRFVAAEEVPADEVLAISRPFPNHSWDLNGLREDSRNEFDEVPDASSRRAGRIRIIASIVLWFYTATEIDPPTTRVIDPPVTHMIFEAASAADARAIYPVRIALQPDEMEPDCRQSAGCAGGNALAPANDAAVAGAGAESGLAIPRASPEMPMPEQDERGGNIPPSHAVRPGPLDLEPGLQGLRFSIGPDQRAPEALRTRKRFEINGGAAKSLPIKVADDGSIEVDAKGLLRELDGVASAGTLEKLSAASETGESISFDELRSAGLDVRYDAVRDRVMIEAPKP